jgi:membrane-associated phospholipid phosphatase
MSTGRAQPGNRGPAPLLDARPGGPAERFADRLRQRHPATVFFVGLLTGFALLAAISIAIGLLVTDVLLQTDGLAHTDEGVIKSLVSDRTPLLTDVSEVGSTVGGAPLLPILVAAIALVCVFLREWRIAAFAVFVLVVESATYRVTSLAVPRDRPHVQRLEDLPVDASYPSGHTAAAIAVYAGLVLLLTSRVHSRALRIAAWAGALLIAAFVARARMYRGMHHPLDVAGGVLVGIGALLVLLFACRAAGVAHAARSSRAAALARSRHAEPIA